MKMFSKLQSSFLAPLASLLSIGSLLVIAACTTVEETGRSQLMMVSEEKETQMGLSAFEEYKQGKKISQNSAYNAQLKRVGQRLQKVVDMPGAQWEFVVFEDDTPNAFALPGGKIGVHTGLFAITKNDAGLAAVIGHEIAHITARHGAERMSQAQLANYGGLALSIGLSVVGGEIPGAAQSAIMDAYGYGAMLGAILPFSRKHELEADYVGTLYMARAEYDPKEAVALWERMATYNKDHGKDVPTFLSTHPVDSDRIAKLQQNMPAFRAEYQRRKG